MKRIAITGVGTINGAGLGYELQHECLKSGGVTFQRLGDVMDYYPFEESQIHRACLEALVSPVFFTDQQLAEMVDVRVKDYDRHQLFALIVAEEAMLCLGGEVDVSNFATVGGIGGDGLLSIFDTARRVGVGQRASPRDNIRFLSNIFVGHISRRYGLKGPSHVHGTACAASMHAINDAARMIMLGEANGALVVGAEAAISSLGIGTFAGQRVLGNGLTYQSERDGFVMGEGAAAIVMEPETRARARNAHIFGYVIGYGESSDGDPAGAITAPSPDGATRSMQRALQSAGILNTSIDLIKTHGTATKDGDVSELRAIHQIASEPIARNFRVMSLKSYFGHLLGAAGIAEIVAILACMENSVILPTKGLTQDNLDPECDVVRHVCGQPISTPIHTVLCNGFGFGGTNSTIVLGTA